MAESTLTLMEDIEQAGREELPHLFAAIVAAVVSLLLPFVGIIAVYSGYRVMTAMDRSWFGLFFIAFGLAGVLSWLLLVIAGQ